MTKAGFDRCLVVAVLLLEAYRETSEPNDLVADLASEKRIPFGCTYRVRQCLIQGLGLW